MPYETRTQPDCAPGFAIPGDPGHSGPHAAIAYSRTIASLRRVPGPYFDLGALWEAHVACEFTTRDAAAAMATMVDEPYVNGCGSGVANVSY